MALYKNIQTLIFSIFILFFAATSSHAADATFSWTTNTGPVAGYKIHYGTSSHNYTFIVDVGLPQAVNGSIAATVHGLLEGHTYYFAATAYSATVESDYSVEVVHTFPGTASSPSELPVAMSTSISTNQNTSYSGQLSATDTEGDNLTYTLVAQAGKGTATLNMNGSFTYTPSHDITGTDSFTFKVSDGSSFSNTAAVNITINPVVSTEPVTVNKAPITHDSTFSVDQSTTFSGQLVATDEDGDAISYNIATGPDKATIVMNSNGFFTYTPNPDATGADLFTFSATDGKTNSNASTVNILINVVTNADANKFAFESGDLQVTTDWQHVDFSNQYKSPSVVAKSTTSNDPETGLVTIKNLTSTGFDIRIREWDYVDGVHSKEIVSYMAMERGRHQIAENVYAVAECTSLSGLKTFQPIKFANTFSSQPVIVSSIVTKNESNAAILRMKDITPQGFSIAMQEQENNDSSHVAETACYIAMEQWSGVVDGLMVEIGSTEKVLTHTPSTVLFKEQFPTIPFVLADIQSTNGTDTATLGMNNLTITDTGMTIQEEQSADKEVLHAAEIGGYFAITPYNSEEDSDNDGLTNAEELTFHTHPGLWDTDGDGISDGEEYLQSLNTSTWWSKFHR